VRYGMFRKSQVNDPLVIEPRANANAMDYGTRPRGGAKVDVESLERDNDRSVDTLGDRVGLLKTVRQLLASRRRWLSATPRRRSRITHALQRRLTVASGLSCMRVCRA